MTLKKPRSSLAGWMLVATPSVQDKAFRRAVVLVCAHSSSGALGLMVNRPAPNMTLRRLFKEKGVAAPTVPLGVPIFAGGPADIDNVIVMHKPVEADNDATIPITDQIEITPTLDMVGDLACGHPTGSYAVTLGHCAWSAGGIERELADGTWLLAPARPEIMFNAPIEERWEAAMRFMRVPPERFSPVAGHA
ncbi:YqgE/AlgH family protein [Jannaschia seohaensis]|uniref:UPF0301 protein BCF38_12512 n=1 Tax=Jannaschia seohaensis TaxID=475081 RepID=A0A2Y9BBT6_9RHOB|nr:YqgE/AlgH family protein [Jannaschia seohaensis]PWJ10196.1 putative transcriptional regulator [Jannaschia seohaensis]SSA51769.1 putative transcriptional regulator [Jannaschia seohaensis]